MGGKPAPAGAAFAILLFAPGLRGDKLRLQRYGAVVTGRNDRGLDPAILILTYGGLASGFSKARVAMSCCQEGKTT